MSTTRHAKPRRRLRLLALIVAFVTLPLSALTLPAQAASDASSCGCTGDYVAPQVSAGVTPKLSGTPEGYSLTVQAGSVQVTKDGSSTPLVNQQFTGDFHTGFAPGGTKFVVWGTGWVRLFDLTGANPNQAVWGPVADSPGATSSGVGFSGKGKYLSYAEQANGTYAHLWVVDTTTGHAVYDDQVAVASTHLFSPDQDRLLITTATGTGAQQELYDLTARRVSWSGAGSTGSQDAFFSPGGKYLGMASVSAGNHVDLILVPAASTGSSPNTPVASASFTAVGAPGSGTDQFGYVGWGFSPDKANATFVYAAANGSNGVTLVTRNLTNGTSWVSYPYTSVAGGFWEFSPCGDYLALAVQDATSPANTLSLTLLPTSFTGTRPSPVASGQYGLDVAVHATESAHLATSGGVDYKLIANTGCSGTPGDGTGNAPSGPGAPGSGSGQGTPGGGGTVPGGVNVTPTPQLSSFTTDRVVAVAGDNVTGTLTLDTGAGDNVTLISSDPTALAVPASVWVPQPGSGTFTAHADTVTSDEIVTITATVGGSSRSVRVAVAAPCAPAAAAVAPAVAPMIAPGGGPVGDPTPRSHDWRGLKTFTLGAVIATGGTSSTGTVTLTETAKTDTTVTLTSADPAALELPASVVVPAGSDTVTFPVTTHAVSDPVLVSALARSVRTGIRTAAIAVLPPAHLTAVTFDPASVTGGETATGTVHLDAPLIVCAEREVSLSSSDPAVEVPGTLTVDQGSDQATFTATTGTVTSDTDANVTAALASTSVTGSLTVTPAVVGVSNDNFADALDLAVPGQVSGDTRPATTQAGEQLLSGTCYVLPSHHLENTVWFKVTATETGTLEVSTANPGTDFDSVLALYQDPGTSNVGDLSAPIGCDNNGDPDNSGHHTGPNGTVTPTWSSIMDVAVAAGQTYYLQLGGVGGGPAGDYVLTTRMLNP